MTAALPACGDLAEHPLPRLLLDLYRQRWRGALVLRREGVEKRVVLRDGVPVMAESNLPSETLGIQLLDAGRITREDYARLVETVKRKRCKEGVALLGLELVGPKDLFEALKQQVRRRLLDCLGWSRGAFALEPGDGPDDANAFRCDPVPLVQEAVAIHWSGAALRAALAARMQSYPVATPRTEAIAQRLHRDADVDRVVAGVGGADTLGALLGDGYSPTALAAAFVLDAVGALAFAEAPPAAVEEGAPAPHAGPDFEFVVAPRAGAAPRKPSADPPGKSRAALAAADRQAAALRDEITALHAALGDKDHYALLGVDRGAQPGAIRRAYVAAAKRFHPDAVARMGLADMRHAAEAVFGRIAEAHEVLSDAARRNDYDRSLDAGGEDVDAARLVQAEALYRKAEILLRGGNFTGALEFLRPAVALWPEEPAYQSALGWSLYKKSPADPKAAREHLEQAIALDAFDAVAHFRLGMVLRALGETQRADEALAQARRLDPKVRS
ncbi:MAG: hypothetical protein DCC71_24990 [Proteobacteria bacterium]|nr:MAG: hypothetical protein DCC71_24990 [Pseudomonadota bacterium]